MALSQDQRRGILYPISKILVKYSDDDNLDEAKEIILTPGDNFHVIPD